MAPEGMVHALEIIHSLLPPGGCLIDIHPNGEPPSIEACIAGQIHLLGYLQETDDFVEYGQASAALDEAVQQGLFMVEQQDIFTFITSAGSMSELHAFLNESWTDAVIPAQVGLKASELSLLHGQISSVQLIEQVLIARLRKINPN